MEIVFFHKNTARITKFVLLNRINDQLIKKKIIIYPQFLKRQLITNFFTFYLQKLNRNFTTQKININNNLMLFFHFTNDDFFFL